MSPMQKYPHTIELFACILNIFVFMFLFPIKVLISLGRFSTPKLCKYIISTFFTYKAIKFIPKSVYSSRFAIYVPSFYLFFFWGGGGGVGVVGQIISTINSIKSRFILIIFLHFEIC